MANQNLVDLRTAIATNALNPKQQAHLLEALDDIIPTFPSPAQVIPTTEEALARQWMCALYAIQDDGGAPLPPTPPGMTISRIVYEVIAGATIATGDSDTSNQLDILQDDDSVANLNLYVTFTSTETTGTVDVSIWPIVRDAGDAFKDDAPLVASITPIAGTKRVCVNLPSNRLPSARYFQVNVLNNGTGADLTAVTVEAEVTKTS